MSQTAISAPPVLVDVPVVLTAIIRPEPEAGGYLETLLFFENPGDVDDPWIKVVSIHEQ